MRTARSTSRARPKRSGAPTAFSRRYPYSNAEWEKLSIFLNLLTPKLPAPKEEDLSKGILEAIDMDSYRVEKKAAMKIALADADAEIEPVPTDARGHKPSPSWTGSSNILKASTSIRHTVHRQRPGRDSASATTSRPRSPPTRPTRTRRRTRRTPPAWRTTRRWPRSCNTC